MTTQISCTQGTTRSAVSISCAAGEELSIVISLFNTNGTARNCSGGTVSFSFERPSRTGTPLRVAVSGQSNGVHTIVLLESVTRLLDNQYVWDAWYTPASGAPEKLIYNGVWTVNPAVGSGGDLTVDSILSGLSIPTEYVAKSTPSDTISATLEDVPGASVSLTLTHQQWVMCQASFELQTQSGASATTIGVAIVHGTTAGPEYQRYLSGANDQGVGAIVFGMLLAAGTHTIKLQFRRVSGIATPGINKADLLVCGTMLQ